MSAAPAVNSGVSNPRKRKSAPGDASSIKAPKKSRSESVKQVSNGNEITLNGEAKAERRRRKQERRQLARERATGADNEKKHVRSDDTVASAVSMQASTSSQERPSVRAERSDRARENHEKGSKARQRREHRAKDGVKREELGQEAAALVPDSATGRKKRKKGSAAAESVALPVDSSDVAAAPTLEVQAHNWSLSTPLAGRFLDQDPVFVKDKQGTSFVVYGTALEVLILSLDTSLVVHTHSAPAGAAVLCFAKDGKDGNIIYIAHSDRSIIRWDWSEDIAESSKVNIQGRINALAVAFTVNQRDEGTLYYLGRNGQSSQISHEENVLHSTEQQLSDMLVLDGGQYILCRGPSVVVLGVKQSRGNDSRTDYSWVNIPLTSTSTCFAARLLPSAGSTKSEAKRKLSLQLAIGNATGQIHLYDLDTSFIYGSGKDRTRLPAPRILHWHREAVSTIKFSQDGTYLISGGTETVLVIWQLETGKKQFLPHLTSAIERLAINANGDRYALLMGDNSVMVLSTAELKAVASIGGLSAAANAQPLVAMIHPTRSQELLITVPSSRSSLHSSHPGPEHSPRPFLQMFSLLHNRHLTRQALTRNNVTDFNLSPEQQPILPPDVKFLAASADGMWLATVDEWMPPASDVRHLASSARKVGMTTYHDTDVQLEREKRREVFLKFWSRSPAEGDAGEGMWTLSTRADAPHARQFGGSEVMGAGRILALAASPVGRGFVTVGEDCSVRFWTPKRRRREKEVLEWGRRWSVQIPLQAALGLDDDASDDTVATRAGVAALAVSDDGSLVAVTLQRHLDEYQSDTTEDGEAVVASNVVHFIDTATGHIAVSKTGLVDDGISALGFMERYLIVISKSETCICDLVQEALISTIPFTDVGKARDTTLPLLAINHTDGTFALVGVARRSIDVYTPREGGCVYHQAFQTRIEAVLSGKGRKGFVAVFEDATIRTCAPRGSKGLSKALARHAASASATSMDVEAAGLDDTAEEVDAAASTTQLLQASDRGSFTASRVPPAEDTEDDRPVVRPEDMAKIFDVGGALPVRKMFREVLGLFARKPLVVAGAL